MGLPGDGKRIAGGQEVNTFYFSGIQKRETAEVLTRVNAAGMISRLDYSANLMAACPGRLVMDSGAFTAPLSDQDIQKYADLIISLGDRCEWYANADKIGDQAASNRNYDFLLSCLPQNLHDRILWVYQRRASLDYLRAGLRQHKRVGIGGLVPLFLMPDKTLARHTLQKIAAICQEAEAEPHYFGLGVASFIAILHDYHESFSVDNTTWLIGAKYGLLVNDRGQQKPPAPEYDFDKESLLRQNIRSMRKWVEVAPAEIKSGGASFQLSWEDLCAS